VLPILKDTETMTSEHAYVGVHLMSDPSLWYWNVVDSGTGGIPEGCWSTHWAAFEFREDARAAGWRRLAILLSSPRASRSSLAMNREPIARPPLPRATSSAG
jgi:hypothetical protein